jgi:transposase-like protein
MECKAKHQRQAKPVTRDWLYTQYVTNGLDTTQIAHIVKRDPKSVWNWLKDFGIPTRPRGTGSLKHHFQAGHKLGVGRKLSAETKEKIRRAAIADGRVPFDRAVGPNGGRRGAAHPSWRGGITADRQAHYSSQEWIAVARQVWSRDKKTCQRCGRKHKTGDPFDIHHVVSFKVVELRTTLSNLVLLCEPCHYWVHGKQNVEKLFIKEL